MTEVSPSNVVTADRGNSLRGAPTTAGAESWSNIITPRRGWFDWRLGELWRYRDLIRLFVWRDFVSVYKQTILGPLWHVIQPLLTTVMFTLIFNRVARLSTDGVPPFLFYLLGNVAWSYFSSNLTKIAGTLSQNAHLLGKVYFHRLVVPVSATISNMISFMVQVGFFLFCLTWYCISSHRFLPTAALLWSPLLLLMLAGYSLAAGIIVSALTTRYRDLANLVVFGVQLLMYATPVIYPSSSVPAKFRWIVELNPLTPVLEGLRVGFFGAGLFDVQHLAISFAVMLGVLCLGLMLFTHVERVFMDTI